MAMWLTLGLAGAVRHTDHGATQLFSGEDVDCSRLKPAPASEQAWKAPKYDYQMGDVWSTHFQPENCSNYFIYYPRKSGYVVMQQPPDWMNWNTCLLEALWYDRPAKLCDHSKDGSFVTTTLPDMCKEELCNLAKTGGWKAGLFKQKPAKKRPWHARMPGARESIGYEDAFESRCLHGQLQDLFPSFHEFARRYDLITPEHQTFNKKACGCPTADNC